MSNALAQEVEKLVAPLVGEFVARAAVSKNCKVIGTTSDELTHAHLGALAERLEY